MRVAFRVVNLLLVRYSVTGSPLRFTHVRMEHAVGISGKTMGSRLLPIGRPQ